MFKLGGILCVTKNLVLEISRRYLRIMDMVLSEEMEVIAYFTMRMGDSL